MFEIVLAISLYICINTRAAECTSGEIKYPIIWETDFDDICYSKSSSSLLYNTTHIDDALLYQNTTLFMAVRFHHLRTKKLTNGSVVPDYVFDKITNPILMKTSVITGKVECAKQYMNVSEANNDPGSLWLISNLYMADNLWIIVDKEIDYSSSKFIKCDKDNGNVLASFQLTKIQIGFNLKVFNAYLISNDQFLISTDGIAENNNIGISMNSQSDGILLKLNLTSQFLVKSSVCDCQNGYEILTSIEFDGDIAYSLGQKDKLLDSKFYLPESPNQNFPNSKIFFSYGFVDNLIVCSYLKSVIEISYIIIDKSTLNIVHNFEISLVALGTTNIGIWLAQASFDNNMNYHTSSSISLYKVDYNLQFLDSCIGIDTLQTQGDQYGLDVNLGNISYSYQMVSNLTFNCQLLSTPVLLDGISDSEFTFNDTPHEIWPRPYEQNYNSCKFPNTQITSINNTFSYQINNSMAIFNVDISDQCQGVPINQTMLLSISPQVDTNFLTFLPKGVLEINTRYISQVGLFSLQIVNQVKILSPNITNYQDIKYAWDNPISFNLQLLNEPPQLISNLNGLGCFSNKKCIFKLVFKDKEDDDILIKLSSSSFQYDMTFIIYQNSNNNYTIEWTPGIDDVGIVVMHLIYYDQFHIDMFSVNIQIEIIDVINPCLSYPINNTFVYAGQEIIIDIPFIKNPSNVVLDFNIQVNDSSSVLVDASDWMTFNQSAISLFPKCELLKSQVPLNFTITVILTLISNSTFILTIEENQESKVCQQADMHFIAGIANSVDLSKLFNIGVISKLEIIIKSNKIYYEKYFSLTDKFKLLVSNTSNKYLGYCQIYLQFTNDKELIYQSNIFNLEVIKNYPPTAVFHPNKTIFYYGNLINMISLSETLFIDNNGEYYINECYDNNSKIVSYSKLNTLNKYMLSARVSFSKNFMGICTYTIVSSDVFNQTAELSFDIQVIPCAQKDCIRCSGPKQSDCELCSDGYELDTETGVCYFIGSTSYHSLSNLFLIQVFTCLSTLTIYCNQILLISLLMNSPNPNTFNGLISTLQLSKLDFKFMDVILHARKFISSIFYCNQSISMEQLEFESGSTFANFINLFILLFLYQLLLILLKVMKWLDDKIETFSFVKYFHKTINTSFYIFVMKLTLTFMLVNCISELMNQINSNPNGSKLSYISSDILLILIILIIVFQHKFNSPSTVLSSESVISHERMTLIKMALSALCFALKDLFGISKWCIIGIQLAYIVYLLACCSFTYPIIKILFVSIHFLVVLTSFEIMVMNTTSQISKRVVVSMVILINILTLIFSVIQVIWRIRQWFAKCNQQRRQIANGDQENGAKDPTVHESHFHIE